MQELSLADLMSLWTSIIERRKVIGESANEFRTVLKGFGYHRLGHGFYGSCWKSPMGRVLKMNFSLQGQSDGWWLWATASQDNDRNPWMPKVHHILRCDSWYIAEVEELIELPKDSEVPVRDYKVLDINLIRAIDIALDLNYRYGWMYRTEPFEKYRQCPGTVLDVHTRNWMRRENGQLVLNDPIAALSQPISDTMLKICSEVFIQPVAMV